MEKIYIKMILIWILTAFVLVKVAKADTVSSTSHNITQCGNLTCYNHGRCANVTLGKPDRCVCQKGYLGDSCELDIDECRGSEPCFHRGQCENHFGGYRCKCYNGWSGEEDHCKDKVNSTTIRKCDKGWGGEWCQDECLNDTMCGPHKECYLRQTNIISQTGHRCRCSPGWLGRYCTHDKDECLKSPCPSDRFCLNTQGSYICTCLPGWKGNNCTTDIDECSINTCQHSTNCSNSAGSYNCTCEKGWTGANCTDDIDECLSKPCNNRQTCNNTQGSYECHCKRGWNGSKCDVDINECLASPCLNTGNCINTNGSYYCNCTSGWQGDNCEDDIDECDKNPCNGTLTCTNSLGSYSCSTGQTSATVSGNTDARKTYISVGSVLGAFLLLCCIVAFVYIWKKKKKRNGTRVSSLNGNEKFSSKNNQVPTSN